MAWGPTCSTRCGYVYRRLRLQAHLGYVRRLGAELHVDGLLVGHTARRLHVLDDPAMRIEELPNLS